MTKYSSNYTKPGEEVATFNGFNLIVIKTNKRDIKYVKQVGKWIRVRRSH